MTVDINSIFASTAENRRVSATWVLSMATVGAPGIRFAISMAVDGPSKKQYGDRRCARLRDLQRSQESITRKSVPSPRP